MRDHGSTDDQWAVLAPHWPPQRPAKTHRLMVEGMLWRLRRAVALSADAVWFLAKRLHALPPVPAGGRLGPGPMQEATQLAALLEHGPTGWLATRGTPDARSAPISVAVGS